MAARELPQATALDKALLVTHVAKIAAKVTGSVVANAVTFKPRDVIVRDAFRTMLRTHLNGLNMAQHLLMRRPSTTGEYIKYARKNGFSPTTDLINGKLPLHWIGPKDAQKVLLYFHGGGYFFAASPQHILWLHGLQRDISEAGHSFSIAILSYTLSDGATWPQQLQEPTDALRFLLEETKRKPGDICIGGDSAGGNMALNLISHLLHPEPNVKPLELSEPLMTAFVISPFVGVDLSMESWEKYKSTDYITLYPAVVWTDFFLDGHPKNPNNAPLLGDKEWFRGADKIVNDLWIWVGGSECFVDGIKALYQKLKPMLPGTELVVKDNAVHVDFVIQPMWGVHGKAEDTETIEKWLKARI